MRGQGDMRCLQAKGDAKKMMRHVKFAATTDNAVNSNGVEKQSAITPQ